MQAVGMSPEMARDMLTQLEQYLIGMDARIETPDKPKTPADDTSLCFLNDLATAGNTTPPG